MGLDIHKCAITNDPSDSALFLKASDTNKSKLALFDHFSKNVVEVEQSYYDFQPLLNANELKEIRSMYYEDGWHVLEGMKDDDITISIIKYKINDVPKIIMREKALYYYESGYQRKGMMQSFFEEWVSGCWYEQESSKDPDLAEIFVFTNDRLKSCKKHCNLGNILLSWKLESNEFIYFDY